MNPKRAGKTRAAEALPRTRGAVRRRRSWRCTRRAGRGWGLGVEVRGTLSAMVRLEAAFLIAFVALSAPPATAQTVRDPFADLLARRTPAADLAEQSLARNLGNGCQPISAFLTWTADDEEVHRESLLVGGPLSESAEELVRNRLRLAGLYALSSRTEWSLWVHLRTVHGAFAVDLELHERVLNLDGSFRRLEDRYLDQVLVSAGRLGWPRRDHVLHVISERIDRFVLQYRRANAGACR